MAIKIIAHLADIHIRNKVRHDEYEEQFDKLYEGLSDKFDGYEYAERRIVISGDIVHQKNTISNELNSIVPRFIRTLEELAPVVIIAGNHDLLQTNQNSLDTLSGMFEAAQFKKSIFLDKQLGYKSGCFTDDNVIWCLYSIFDDFAKTSDMVSNMVSKGDRYALGLFHGTVVGSVYCNGNVSENGVDVGLFSGCDAVLAGDIHKRQVVNSNGVEVVYPGSLIQQDYGENVSQHGYCLWYLEEGSISHEFVDLESDYGMYKFTIKGEGDVDSDMEIIINQ